MVDFINTHNHILNFRFIPDDFYKIKFPVGEGFLKSKVGSLLALGARRLGWSKYNEVIKLMKKEIEDVARVYVEEEMADAGIVLSTPLMMDLEFAMAKSRKCRT